MTRRSFLSVLAALPFVGRFIPQAESEKPWAKYRAVYADVDREALNPLLMRAKDEIRFITPIGGKLVTCANGRLAVHYPDGTIIWFGDGSNPISTYGVPADWKLNQ